MKPFRALFLCKLQHDYGQYHDHTFSSGLFQSALFVANMFLAHGIEAKVVQVVDNNSIDREVALYKPTHVFIEALWVVPEKFAILTKLHPTVKWITRLHSNTPFIAQEGIATDWLSRYLDFGPQMFINCNGQEMCESLGYYLTARYELVRDNFGQRVNVAERLSFLPNFYPVTPLPVGGCEEHDKRSVDIGCFGAVRVLKDQLIQAIAAIQFAEDYGKNLRFHINATRVEGGNQPLKNLRNLFKQQVRHELVEHSWLPHADFLALVRSMDLGMQVSFSETFNICAADFANECVPIVVSPEIPWANWMFAASPTSSRDIVAKLKKLWRFRRANVAYLNKLSLTRYAREAERRWLAFAGA